MKKEKEVQLLKNKANDFALEASMFEIENQEDYQSALERVKGAKEIKKKIKGLLDPFVKEARKSYYSARDRLKFLLEPVTKGERIYRDKSSAYYKKQLEIAEKKKEEVKEKINEDDLLNTEVSISTKPEKQEGVSYREQWSAEVTDLKALVKAIAEGKASIELIKENKTALNKQAAITKGKSNIPGVEFKSKQIMNVR